MSGEDQIKWVALTLTFSPEQETWLEKMAQAAGLSLKCYCVHMLYKHLLQDAPVDRMESWREQLAITLSRNGCHETLLSDAR
jgi:hypothetical protein